MTQRAGFSAVLFLVTVAFVVFASATWPERIKPKDPGLAAMTRIAALRTSAVLGRAAAQYELAECYSNGKDVTRDVALAGKWYLRAAENGHLEAQFRLGYFYSVGEGVAKSDAEAVRWWERAANAGHLRAASFLVGFHGSGVKRPVNAPETLKWLRVLRASGQYFGVSYKVAWAASRGWGQPRDPRMAVKLLKEEIATGSKIATCDLGALNATGEGVERDSAKAVRLWHQAIGGWGVNFPLLVCWHGLCNAYATGDGVERDAAKAAQACDRVKATIHEDISKAPSDPNKMTIEMFSSVETARLIREAKVVRDSLAPELKKQASRGE